MSTVEKLHYYAITMQMQNICDNMGLALPSTFRCGVAYLLVTCRIKMEDIMMYRMTPRCALIRICREVGRWYAVDKEALVKCCTQWPCL